MAEMKFDNARDPEQLRRMKQAEAEGKCYLCDIFKARKSDKSGIFLHVGKNWFVKKNDFPYEGSVHHYLIVSREHVTKLSDINRSAGFEFLGVIEYLENILDVEGFSLFVRSGNMSYTGATLDHLHFHFMVGAPKPENAKIEDNILVTLGYKK